MSTDGEPDPIDGCRRYTRIRPARRARAIAVRGPR